MNRRCLRISTVITLLLSLGGIGCQQDAEEEIIPEPSEAVSMEEAVDIPRPDTTAQDVWEHLQQEAYQDNWDFWPDREPFYQGTEPHGMLLSTYLNDLALRGLLALRERSEIDDLPFGSIIVKENYTPDSTLAAITVMYKSERYDPDHHDWWWMKRLADGTVEAAGQVSSCIQCHEAAEEWDYLMTQANEAVQ